MLWLCQRKEMQTVEIQKDPKDQKQNDENVVFFGIVASIARSIDALNGTRMSPPRSKVCVQRGYTLLDAFGRTQDLWR